MRVAAVIVAWNRRDLLREALEAIVAQTRPLDSIVVIDNASDDDSAEVARAAAPGATIIRLDRNTGGAGGFAVGIAAAIARTGADLVWAMDDDTIPTPTALEELLAVRDRLGGAPTVYASRVIWTDGSDHPMNTPRESSFASRGEKQRARAAGAMAVRSASFVSLLVDARAVLAKGLPISDYFIWNDDFEFTTRLIRGASGVYCPSSVVVHKTKALASTDVDPGPRFYNEVRNKVWLFTRSRGLGPLEKAVYLGSTLRRWARTMRASSDKPLLREGRRRGLADGLRAAPRTNERSLADLPEAVAVLAEFEALR